MNPDASLAGEAHTLLSNLYTTGTQSDLIIRSASKTNPSHSRDFKVHKCIVYPAIPILEAIQICNRNFTIVKLAESEVVVDAMLRHVYKLPLPFVPNEADEEAMLLQKSSLENVLLAIELRRAAIETQFDIPSLIPLAEIVIGNSLCRITQRTFDPEPSRVSVKLLQAEKKLSSEECSRFRAERQAALKRAAAQRPVVEFVRIVLALEARKNVEGEKERYLAALFLLATRMSQVVDCAEALRILREERFELYKQATTLAFAWLKLARRGESKEERKSASLRMWQKCAASAGFEWRDELFEHNVFAAAQWGHGENPWTHPMLEGEQYDDEQASRMLS